MNKIAALALTVASMLLIVMAVLVNSSPLFYMTVAVGATLFASRLQAWLAVRGLRFERAFPPTASIGEPVTIETIVWSERRLKRPLVTVEDVLPESLSVKDRTPSLPVAPSFDQPIKTRFTFRPMRRGRFHWKNLLVVGTDALGLGSMEKVYSSDPVELTVYPVAIPVGVDIRPGAGWGVTDLDSGFVRGVGIDPRGVREYAYGDPLKHVHWRSSARHGRLMVKEFETGSGLNMAFVMQQTRGCEVGPPGGTTFEAMCGHALYLATLYIDRGATVWFPGIERPEDTLAQPETRTRAVKEILTDVQPNKQGSLSQTLSQISLREGSTLVMFLALQDPDLAATLLTLHGVRPVCLVYNLLDYDKDSRAPSAAEPAYISALESVGAEVHVMPHVQAVS